MTLKKIAWGITGAGHFLDESYRVFKDLRFSNKDMRINTFLSGAAEEVLQMYGLDSKLVKISRGGYLEEVFRESEQGSSCPKAGRFLLGKYDALVITPATSNTVAKIVQGIADTLVTNAVAQAVKGGVPVYVVPVDVAGEVISEMPYFIDRELCQRCEVCPPKNKCSRGAISDQIELLKCKGCGICVELCNFEAIKGGPVKLRVRDIDEENVNRLRRLEGITVLGSPQEIKDLF